ncbi:MAG TPA: CYTH domain-containing protein [Dissulfurispiraceae bacterium]|nr:CYTH domain-containing protein [Dissulfurispiraceae bacterium]
MIISEKESKLLIDSRHGKRVIEDMKKIEEIASFTLGRNISNDLHDAYFDSQQYDLARKYSYFRIRGRRDGHFITVRNKTSRVGDDIIIDEVTSPLDDKGVRIALSSLADNITLGGPPQMTLPHFTEIFNSIGLEEVLRVRIERVEREIFMEDIKIGKMKADVFQYIAPQTFGPFFEIEVDSYKQALYKSAKEFFSELSTKFGTVAEVSGTSKYVRGINIAYGLTF